MRELAKALLMALVATLICVGCANGGGAGGSTAGRGSIEMYGTIDQGITVHN